MSGRNGFARPFTSAASLLVVALISVGLVAAEAGGADRRSRHRLARHRETGTDGPSGPGSRDSRSRRHPLDSVDDPGTRREDRAQTGHEGDARRRDSRAEQPATRAGAAGRAAEAAVRPKRRWPTCGSRFSNELLQPARGGGDDRSRLQPRQDAGGDGQRAGEGQADRRAAAASIGNRRPAARRAQRNREGTAGEPRRIGACAARRAAVRRVDQARADAAVEAAPARRAESSRRNRPASCRSCRWRSGQQVAPAPISSASRTRPAQGRNQDRGNAGQRHPDRPEGRDRYPRRVRAGPGRPHRSVGAERHADR